MPQSQRSLRLTDAYRLRLISIAGSVERTARQTWPRIEELDSTLWPDVMASAVTRAQAEGVRLTAGYLGAFIRSETGRGRAPTIRTRDYAGRSRDGRPLTEALTSPLIGVRAGLKEGFPPGRALDTGLYRGLRMVEVDFMHATRQALADAMEADPRIEGWQRSVRGTCGACAGDIAVEVSVNLPSIPLRIHPNCMCVTQPVVIGVRDLFPLPTGQQIFERMGRAEQDEQFGEDKAEALRSGSIGLADLVETSPLETADDFITEAPLAA